MGPVNSCEVLENYTLGTKTLEEANASLEAMSVKFRLDPDKATLTADEIEATTVGDTPGEANGWGILDTGNGNYNKVKVENGKLLDVDCGLMYALLFIKGKMYEVKGSDVVKYTQSDS